MPVPTRVQGWESVHHSASLCSGTAGGSVLSGQGPGHRVALFGIWNLRK